MTWNPGWRTKLVAFVIGVIIAAIFAGKPQGYGWGGAILCGGAAVVVPALAYQRLWGTRQFWVTLALLTALQVPVVIGVRPLIEQFRFMFILVFGSVDCMFVIAVIYWACVKTHGGGSST